MNGWLRDRIHLIRMLGLMLALLVVFLVVRSVAVPKGFGLYGHYRAPALDAIAARPPAFAGHAVCEECHDDVVAVRKGSKHAQIHCETCHGASAAHAANPDSVRPVLPDGRKLCLGCHTADAARPSWFPQIDPKEHAPEGLCTECHPHHHPEPEGS